MSFCSLAEGVRVGWEPLDEVVVILLVMMCWKRVLRVVGRDSREERLLETLQLKKRSRTYILTTRKRSTR